MNLCGEQEKIKKILLEELRNLRCSSMVFQSTYTQQVYSYVELVNVSDFQFKTGNQLSGYHWLETGFKSKFFNFSLGYRIDRPINNKANHLKI